MPPRISTVTRIILSGVMLAISLTSAQTARANEQAQSTKAEIEQPTQPKPSSQTAKPSVGGPKLKKGTTSPAPIEPFIRADAVALGQWLVVKTVKNLVDKPVATTNKPAPDTKVANSSAAKPTKAQPTAQPPVARQVAVRALPPEPSSNPTIDSYTEMRVALTRQASSVVVAASNGGIMASTDGELVQNLSAGVGYQITANDGGLFINGQPVPTAIWLEPDNGYVAVGDRWYRGRLLLLWQNGGVMAVNYVMLQEYLYSVVGAEMSASWSLEALKAQAVAARSYAIVHTVRHQGRVYDLDDTQRYQAYKGIMTEASSTHQAVHDTSGEFISYGGGIVESLYAANQDIVDDAHSGYGMSQMGALDLAEKGYQYYEILSAYYPDTSVGRIDISD